MCKMNVPVEINNIMNFVFILNWILSVVCITTTTAADAAAAIGSYRARSADQSALQLNYTKVRNRMLL